MASPSILNSKPAMIALAAVLLVAALVGLAGTQWGRNLGTQLGVKQGIEQIGIKEGIAQTVGAAKQAATQTTAALNSFIGRSPGERGATDALKGKAKRLAKRNAKPSDNVAPIQRALGKIFDKPVGGTAEPVSSQPSLAVLPDEVIAFAAPLAGLAPPISGGPGIFVPSSGGFIGGGGGGGGGGGTPITPPTTVVPPVISPVPEPSTWILLLFGFGAIGASLRRTVAISKRAGHCAQHC